MHRQRGARTVARHARARLRLKSIRFRGHLTRWGRRYPPCRGRDRRVRRSSGARGSSGFEPDGARKSRLGSSNRPHRRFATGWSKRSATQGAAGMGRAPRSARRCVGCAERIGVCVKHEMSWQKVRRTSERSNEPSPDERLIRSGDGAGEVDRFMRANQAEFPIATMARVLGVSPSGDDVERQRECSAREASDQTLRARIEAIHERSRGTDGARGRGFMRIWPLQARRRACQAGGSVGARSRLGRSESSQGAAYHVSRLRGPPGAGPGRASLRSRGPGPAVGGRYHRHPDRGGALVSGRGARRIQPPGRAMAFDYRLKRLDPAL